MAYTKPQEITGAMPERCHKEDRQWINEKLLYCDAPLERIKVCEAYSKVYSSAFNNEVTEHRKSNAARKAANSRLREYVAKKFRVFNK